MKLKYTSANVPTGDCGSDWLDRRMITRRKGRVLWRCPLMRRIDTEEFLRSVECLLARLASHQVLERVSRLIEGEYDARTLSLSEAARFSGTNSNHLNRLLRQACVSPVASPLSPRKSCGIDDPGSRHASRYSVQDRVWQSKQLWAQLQATDRCHASVLEGVPKSGT